MTIFSQEIFENEKEIRTPEKYNFEEIQINTSKDGVKLFGTLITPKNDFKKIIIIVSGTGKISQYAHNFLTESLLKNNIGVFRFDKRGVGKSSGYYNDLPKIYTEDFMNVVQTLKRNNLISNKKIGALGHSLGGLVTIESIKRGTKLDFLIQWSAPVGKARDLMEYQLKQGIKNYDNIVVGKNLESRIELLKFVHKVIDENLSKGTWEIWKTTLKEAKKKGFKKKDFKNYITHDFVEIAKINNTETYEGIDFPTLFIIGEYDNLVDPNSSIELLEKINNKFISVKKFASLNHFLTKNGVNENTNEIYNVDEDAKKYLIDWLKK